MGKFTSFAVNANTEVGTDAASTAAQAAADAIMAQARDTTAVATPVEQLGVTQPQVSPESPGLQQVQQGDLLQAPATPEEQPTPLPEDQVQPLYEQQLASELPQHRPWNEEDGSITLPINAKKKGAEVAEITEGVAKMSDAIQYVRPKGDAPGLNALAKLGLAQEVSAGGYTKLQPTPRAGGAAYLAMMIALSKSAGQVDVTPEQVTAQEGATAEEALEAKTANKKALEDASSVGRFALAKSVADEFEQLVRPAPNLDPVTGETTGHGYESALGESEKVGLGEVILQSMQDAGLAGALGQEVGGIQLLQRRRVGKQHQYTLTPRGKEFLDNMMPVLEEVAPGLKRPVSLTPLTEGRFSGAAALRQKGLTKVPLEGTTALTPTMLSAMDVMSQMPNIISEHKMQMTESMLMDIANKKKQAQEANREFQFDQKAQQITGGLEYDQLTPEQKQAYGELRAEYNAFRAENAKRFESPFAKLFDQDQAKLDDLIAESEFGSRFTVEVKKVDGVWVKNKGAKKGEPVSEADQEYFNQENPDAKNNQVAKRSFTSNRRQDQSSHRQFANQVQQMALRKAQKTMADAKNRAGQVFYYGVTAIGNSSRLMVTQTELNYQSNKLARFLVDNPRPTVFKKGEGSSKERAFKYVIARATLNDADLYTPERLLKEFELQQDKLAPVAKAWYAASQSQNPDALASVFRQLEALAEQEIIPDEFEGTGEWGFILDGLHEYGKFLQLPEGGQMATRVKAEVDGINNGSSIQGLQFGSDTILQRAGVIYKDKSVGEKEGLVLPEGNMRDLVFNTLFEPDGSGGMLGSMGLKTETEKVMAESLLDKVRSEGLKKKFIKIPLMTTIYGKPYDMHGDHVRDFLAQNSSKLGLQPDDYKMAAKVLTKAIANGLSWSLNDALIHQDAIKYSAGWFFNMMDEIPQIEGPNGFIIQAGGVDYVPDVEAAEAGAAQKKTGEVEQKLRYKTPYAEKEVESAIELNVQRPSAAAAKAGHGAIGSITRNQLAVSGTHNIDATIAQLTLIRAKRKQGKGFWGQQVFDAFIGDVSSMDDLLDIGNKTFAQVNNTYSMVDAEKKAYEEAKERFAKKVAEAGDVEWGLFDGPYRSIGTFFQRFASQENRWRNHGAMISTLQKFGFDFDEKGKVVPNDLKLNPKQVKALIDEAETNFLAQTRENSPLDDKTMNQAFGALKAYVDKKRSDFRKKYLKQRRWIRQFN